MLGGRRLPGRLPGVLLAAVLVVLLGLFAVVGTRSPGVGSPADPMAGTSPPIRSDAAPLRPASDGPPNIVLITTDDQTTDELAFMPRTRRLLAEQGVEFTRAISPHPLCCPARAELLTGAYAHNNGVRHNTGPFGGYPVFEAQHRARNLGVWLQNAGYTTGFTGKLMNGFGDGSPRLAGWDRWDPITGRVYDYYVPTFADDGRDETKQGYVTDVLNARSTRFVAERSGDDPFFLWVSHVAPHAARGPRTTSFYGQDRWRPPLAAERHRDEFTDATPPSFDKPSFNEPDVSDKPDEVRRRIKVDPAAIELSWQQRARSLAAVDEANEKLIQAVRRNGEIDDTLFIFTSDNGFLFGEHRTREKNRPYLESLAVPLLMRGPGVMRGGTSDVLASTVDITATILEAAGAVARPANEPVDGVSLLAAARGDGETGIADVNVIQGGAADPVGGGWAWRGVHTPRYTLVRHVTSEWELYDRERDPFELENLLDAASGDLLPENEAYAATLKALRVQWLRLIECSGADCEPVRADIPDPL